MGYKYLTLFIFIANAFCNHSIIKGFSTDSESKEPLIGANIMLDGTSLGAASDENGYYLIDNIPSGTYTLRAMFIGYETLEKEILVEGSLEYTIDITLKPSSIELQETRVTAEKRKGKVTEGPASIEIISSRDIKREATTNMGSYLKGLKGVDFTSSGINNYSISIRGFNSSFNTRVLTLTDGRVANIPALRVINYSAVPQSLDDIDRMEVILGPATALYGANAHSGVVNIISKSPAHSEGLTMSVSGSNDERQMRKINGRWAQKISSTFSIKLSGMYLHGYEWPYISETEYQTHAYPWSGNPYRANDGKDNNPGTVSNIAISEFGDTLINPWTNEPYIIGDGEPDHGDLDGDGVAGEDWYNGYDDDGDCMGDTNHDGCYCCGGDTGVDEDFFTANGKDDNEDGRIDENIDDIHDVWNDGYDNDGNGKVDDDPEKNNAWGNNMDRNNIIINGGRSVETIHGKPNPWYNENVVGKDGRYTNLNGNYYYDENLMKYKFDIYIYDFGNDGLPGNHYIDIGGDGIFQQGECLGILGGFTDACDCGLDGICPGDINYTCADADGTEGDGNWQPGDGWVDDGNGVVDLGNSSDAQDQYILPDFNNWNPENDVWPPPNYQWDIGEIIFDDLNNNGEYDKGTDIILDNGIAMDGFQGDPYDDENGDGKRNGDEPFLDIHNDGKYTYPTGEFDGVFDTGDGLYGFEGEDFDDENNNGRWDEGEEYTDINGDDQYTPPDYVDNFQFVEDLNGDGLSDDPDFEVENRKVEFRLDFDPSINVNMTFQGGYSWTKTQQVTGTTRYLADGFEYKYYQLRGRFYNWYSQVYMNQSFSGNTRSYNLGRVIEDRSKNYAFQLQRNDKLTNFNTNLVWGVDYFKTLPSTNGTILNDGPNGYDNDGDNDWFTDDEIDNDGDGYIDEKFCPDGMVDVFFDGERDDSGNKDGKMWYCDEGIDEPDEFDDPETNEYGLYYQTKSELFGTSRFELITAARWDYHDLLAEGIQFAPKIGLKFKPDEKSSFRFTYGKAFNTPNSITLYTDLFIRRQGMFDVYLRGNKDGTPYCRVGKSCAGSNVATASIPGFYYTDQSGDSLFNPISTIGIDYFSGGCEQPDYTTRVDGAPYFFNLKDGQAPADMIPLDTSRYLILIPELNGEGILYTPSESWGIPDVEPIKTEKIQTLELGYKGFVSSRTHFSLDYYISYYEDFFSPPTFITPIVVLRNDTSFVGILPVNDFTSNPPYGTAWNGIDDDGDWGEWATDFGWWDDDDGNCPIGASKDPQNPHPCWADKGEFGFINYDIVDSTFIGIYHPHELMEINEGSIIWTWPEVNGVKMDPVFFDPVGVDEYQKGAGLSEAEMKDVINPNGEIWEVPGVAMSPPHLVLSPMNYGEVWMQGIDVGITQFFPEYDLIIDGNISWYGTTEYYNKLTRKNDPINAPKWKWNASIKWDTSMGSLMLNYRHVDQFQWNDGIWAGSIGPYNIFDFHYNYMLTEHLELNIGAINFMDDRHKELIGGAVMGRQIIMRMMSTF